MAELTSTPTNISFEMVSGDSKTIRVKAVTPQRQPYPLGEVVTAVWSLAKSVKGSIVVTKTLADNQITITQNGSDWYIDVELEPEDTEALVGDYFHECEIRFSDGTVMTPYNGTITFIEDLNQ